MAAYATGKSSQPEAQRTSWQHPFTKRVIDEPLPEEFQIPQMERYDGTSDPLDHVHYFEHIMMLYGLSDAIMCRIFPITLKGTARIWYENLQPNSISTFSDLRQSFVDRFFFIRVNFRTSLSLIWIRQREKETLREYIERFKSAMMKVSNLDQSLVSAALLSGLQPSSSFCRSVHGKPPNNLSEFFAKAEKYIKIEEVKAEESNEPRYRRKRCRQESRNYFSPPHETEGEELFID